MRDSHGRITAPISLLGDIKVVLGESSNDLGTLCRSSQINKWSKHKPVKSSKIGILTADDLKAANYGLKAPTGFSVNAPMSDEFKNARWEYDALGPSDIARMTDFLGYYHSAIAPVPGFGDVELNPVNDSVTFQFRQIGLAPDDSTVALEDLADLKDYYPCICIETSPGYFVYKTAENTFASASQAVTIKLGSASDADFPAVNGKVYPYVLCAFSEKHTSVLDGAQQGRFVPLPSDGNLYGNITYSNDPALYLKVIGVKTGTTAAGSNTYWDIDNYNGKLQAGQIQQALDVSPDGNLSLLLSITNNNANTINLLQSEITYSVSGNLYGATTPASWVIHKLFTAETGTLVTRATLTETNVVSLLPAQQKYIAINLRDGICACDANGTFQKIAEGTQSLMKITFYINNVQNIALSMLVKWGGGNIII